MLIVQANRLWIEWRPYLQDVLTTFALQAGGEGGGAWRARLACRPAQTHSLRLLHALTDAASMGSVGDCFDNAMCESFCT